MISAGVDSKDLAKRGESLIRQSTNRYLTTVKTLFAQSSVVLMTLMVS